MRVCDIEDSIIYITEALEAIEDQLFSILPDGVSNNSNINKISKATRMLRLFIDPHCGGE